MASIKAKNLKIQFPIFSSNTRSLKNLFINSAAGGFLSKSKEGKNYLINAIDDVSFNFTDGDKVALLGHNGSGKSTILRALSSVYEPSSGSLNINGNVNSLIDISLGIEQDLNGIDNIYIRGALLGLSKSDIKAKIQDIINFSELENFIYLPLRTYSSGMQLRLAFAISIIFEPEILLMDEWLTVGDIAFKKKAEEKLMQIVSKTKILVLATHSRELALNTCNRALWFEHGKIIKDDECYKVCDEYFK